MKLSKIMGLGFASAMVHGIGLFSLNQYIHHEEIQSRLHQTKFLTNPKDELAIEFVDTPSQAIAKTAAEKTRRISDKNSVNQDQNKNLNASPKNIPAAKIENPADQLEKRRNETAQAPAPETKPSKAAQKTEETPKAADQFSKEMVQKIETKEPQAKSEQESIAQKESKREEEIKGEQSPDKITTQAMSRTESSGAALFGTTSFEATGSGMGEYMKKLKERIWSSWFPYLAFSYPVDFKGADAIISFTLNSEGEIKMIRVVNDGGDATFASYCMQAVLKASGFGPVPREILALTGKDDFELKFGFHYR